MKEALLLLALAGPAHAQDSWGGSDKRDHFVFGGIIGVVATGVTESPWIGFGVGVGAGVVKEAFDVNKSGGKFSAKDVAATALGSALGATIGGFVLKYSKGHVEVAYATRF